MSSKSDFFSQVDEDRAAETKDFISHMQRPREEVEAPDFELPDLDDEEVPVVDDTGPRSDDDSIHMEYTSEQLWAAELALWKTDEVIAWGLSLFSGESADKYRKRKSVSTYKDDREVQLLAALINKYQMKMSLEAAFLTIFIMGYMPMFSAAYQDAQKKKKAATGKQQTPKRGPIQ